MTVCVCDAPNSYRFLAHLLPTYKFVVGPASNLEFLRQHNANVHVWDATHFGVSCLCFFRIICSTGIGDSVL